MMTRIRKATIIILLLFAVSSVQARRTELILQKASDERYVPAIPVYVINQYEYIAVQELLDAFKTTAFINPDVRKYVLRLDPLRFRIAVYNRYIVESTQKKTYQMTRPVILFEGQAYLPMKDFVNILQLSGHISGVTLLTGTDTEDLLAQKIEEQPEFSPFEIVSANIEERRNGTVIRIKTANKYDAKSVKAWINREEWLYVTLPGATVNKSTLDKTEIPVKSTIRSVTADQLNGTSQLTFRLRGTVEGVDVLHRDSPPEILLTIRRPYVIDQSHFLNQEREKWKLDKIVLDAGHGGHDPGARGNGLKEKDVVLDVVRRLGKLIETRTDIEVVYTRDKDVFIPLRERTKIANEADGKVFLSIHANANNNKRASGFETYLIRPGKVDAAAKAVAEAENAVIKLEEGTDQSSELTAEQLILATMKQSSFTRQSETLADLIQREFDKKLVGQNRGVKQAGFIVLIGATMPNVLIELGFISNKNDARRLKQASYRQKAAESIYQALMKYKTRHEKLLSP